MLVWVNGYGIVVGVFYFGVFVYLFCVGEEVGWCVQCYFVLYVVVVDDFEVDCFVVLYGDLCGCKVYGVGYVDVYGVCDVGGVVGFVDGGIVMVMFVGVIVGCVGDGGY